MWLVVRRKENNPIMVVGGQRYGTKKRAEKKRLGNETEPMTLATSSSWLRKRDGEGNVGIHDQKNFVPPQ